MKKNYFFMAVVGVLLWSCGESGNPTPAAPIQKEIIVLNGKETGWAKQVYQGKPLYIKNFQFIVSLKEKSDTVKVADLTFKIGTESIFEKNIDGLRNGSIINIINMISSDSTAKPIAKITDAKIGQVKIASADVPIKW